VREHSRKPEEFYLLVEELCEGPYLELFARAARPGWICVGDEVNKFTETRSTP
jgi:N6-adenosine-specific RNA methylase IME4